MKPWNNERKKKLQDILVHYKNSDGPLILYCTLLEINALYMKETTGCKRGKCVK